MTANLGGAQVVAAAPQGNPGLQASDAQQQQAQAQAALVGQAQAQNANQQQTHHQSVIIPGHTQFAQGPQMGMQLCI